MMSAQGKRFSRVLIVQQSDSDRRLLCEVLQRDGYETSVAASADDAIDAMGQRNFDAAVVAGPLPDLSAAELLGRIQQRDDQLPVILRADGATRDSSDATLCQSAFGWIENLDDPSELLRQVHLACRQRFDRYALDLEAAVRRRTEELARSNRELTDFASVVAHDLRSPLLTISGYCQLLHEEYQGRLDKTADGYLDIVINGIDRMNRLIQDLLDYSRLDSSRRPFEPIDLGSVLTQVEANLGAMIRESDAKLDVQAMPTVVGDQTQLVQLLQNLVGNAIKFRQEQPPSITVSSVRVTGHYLIRVSDNGIGIDPEHFEKIFQVFHRLPTSRRSGGTGIGLAICKKIVERHGGRIWLESEIGRGTTFLFTLPKGVDGAAS